MLGTEKFGDLKINKKEIQKIRTVGKSQIVEGEYWDDNPHSTRYFFGPNGYGLKKRGGVLSEYLDTLQSGQLRD